MSMTEPDSSRQSTRSNLPLYPWHKQSWQRINQARQSDHLAHAILISGQEHTGKSDFANRLVKSLLCEASQFKNNELTQTPQIDACHQCPCNKCRGCKTFEADSNPDYLHIKLLEDKQQISIDQIRAMNAFLNLSRSFKAYQVVLISEAERMNQNAANSLLKSLEEPADNSVIILLTSQLSAMLPTIKSRCQMMHLPMPDKQQSIDWLQSKTGKLSEFKEELEISHNRPLAALKVDDELIQNREMLLEDIVNIIQEKSAITEIAKKWQKHDREVLIDWQIGWLYQLLKMPPKTDSNDSRTGKSDTEKSINLVTLKDFILDLQLWDIYDQLLKQKQLVHTSVNPLIFLENMLSLWLQARHC